MKVKDILRKIFSDEYEKKKNLLTALSRLILWDTPKEERKNYIIKREIQYPLLKKKLYSLLEDDFKKTLQRFLKEPDSFQRFFTKGEDDGFNFKLSTFQRTESEIVGLLKLLDKNKLFDLEKHLKPLGFETIKEWYKKRKESEKPFIAVERKTSSRPVDEKEFNKLINFAEEVNPELIPVLCLIRYAGLQSQEATKVLGKDIITLEEEPHFPLVEVKRTRGRKKYMPRVTPFFLPKNMKRYFEEFQGARVTQKEITHFLESFRNKYKFSIDVKRLKMWYLYFLFLLDVPFFVIAVITGVKESEAIRKYTRQLREYLKEPPEKYVEESLLGEKERKKALRLVWKSFIKTGEKILEQLAL